MYRAVLNVICTGSGVCMCCCALYAHSQRSQLCTQWYHPTEFAQRLSRYRTHCSKPSLSALKGSLSAWTHSCYTSRRVHSRTHWDPTVPSRHHWWSHGLNHACYTSHRVHSGKDLLWSNSAIATSSMTARIHTYDAHHRVHSCKDLLWSSSAIATSSMIAGVMPTSTCLSCSVNQQRCWRVWCLHEPLC